MLKKSVTYENFDGQEVTKVLYFNITRVRLLENMDLRDRMQAVYDTLEGPERELKPEEIRLVLDMVKELMHLAYGVRSEDGERFIQSEELWQEFTQSAAYDAYLMSLFTDIALANEFIKGVMPKELLEQMDANEDQLKLPQQVTELPESGAIDTVEQSTTVTDLEGLSREELLAKIQKLQPRS